MCCHGHPNRMVRPMAAQAGCFCGCEGPWSLRPPLAGYEHLAASLEKHLKALQDDVQAVEEHIRQIKEEK